MKFEKIFNDFKSKKILIVGDIMIDSYRWGHVERQSPEAPVPIVNLEKKEDRLGGAGNVALNIKALGATPILCSVIGKDFSGNKLLELLRQEKICTDGIFIDETRKTTTKTRIIAHGQQVVRTDYEDIRDVNSDQIKIIKDILDKIISEIDAIIIQDYNKGLLVKDSIKTILDISSEKNIPVYVDPKKDNFFAYNKIRLFKPNLFEFESAINFKEQDKSFEDLGKDLRKKINAEILMVTRSEEGVTLFTDKNVQTISTKARKVHDVSGAGDTAISAFVLADLCGANIEESAMISNYAAGRVCEEVGVVPISLEMIKDIVDHYSN